MITLQSAIEGRQRLSLEPLQGNAILAKQLEKWAEGISAIQSATANPLTGRLLINFDPEQIEQELTDLLSDFLYEKGYQSNTESSMESLEGQPSSHNQFDKDASNYDPSSNSNGNVFCGIKNKLIGLVNHVTGEDSKELYHLIRDAEPDESLSKPLALSSANSVLKLMGPINIGLIMAVGVTGGLPVAGIPILSRIALLSTPVGQLAALTATYFSLSTLQGVVEYKRKNAWDNYATAVSDNLRQKSLEHVHQMDIAQLDQMSHSELSGFINQDSDKVAKFIGNVPHSVIERTITFAVGTTVMFLVAPTAFVISIVPIPILYYITKERRQEISTVFQNKAQSDAQLDAVIADNLNGLTTIRSFSAEERELKRMNDIVQNHLDANDEATSTGNWLTGVTQFCLSSGTASALIYGSTAVLSGAMTFTSLTALSSLLPPMIMSTQGLSRELEQYQAASAAASNILKMRAIEPEVINGHISLTNSSESGSIDFNNVSFSYNPDVPFIKSLNLKIEQGKTVAFVGATGSGKTTIVKLLQRFYDASEGVISIDGVNIRDLELNGLRQTLSIISQDAFLFQTSVKENIRYGRPSATDEEVLEAARAAQAIDFINELPNQFNTVIGEQGKTLSGGQKQRLSIARAILKDAPILVLDEATSAVDNKTEANLQDSVGEITKHKTTIVIAHRLSTVRNADRIYLIGSGEIAEQGSHEELLEIEGAYAELWRLQTQQKKQSDVA